MIRLLLKLAGGVLAALALASAAWAAPPLWVVKSPTATIYLFGTMHILDPTATWRTPALEAAYKESTIVWFETDVTKMQDAATVGSLMKTYGFDLDHPLSGKLDAEHLGELKAELEHDGLPFAGVDKLQPWAAASVLMVAPAMKQGLQPSAGADVELSGSATSDHKTVRAFETLDQQVHFFVDMNPATQLQMLEDTLDENARTNTELKGLESVWVAGDLDKLGPLLLGELKQRYPDLYAAIIQRRNRAWVVTLSTELAGHDVEMVNVGALHMVGDDGLPALLKANGFTVERLQ